MNSHPKVLADNAVRLGDKIAGSAAFKALFKDGMALVEETAAYLDGPGREEARHLPRVAALAYASESMRLTTRLMQIASWLLLQRAVNEGEMSPADAASDKHRTRISAQGAAHSDAAATLPAQLLRLIEASQRLQARIGRLDALIRNPVEPAETIVPPALQAQMSRLRDAFPGTL